MRYKIEYEPRDKRQPFRVIDTESLTTKRWKGVKVIEEPIILFFAETKELANDFIENRDKYYKIV